MDLYRESLDHVPDRDPQAVLVCFASSDGETGYPGTAKLLGSYNQAIVWYIHVL